MSALIDKHRPRTPNTPNEVNILGTGINVNINDKEGTKMAQPIQESKKGKPNQIISQQGYKTQ